MKRIEAIFTTVRRWRVVASAVLSHLADQDAFHRYLQRTNQPASAVSWERFLRERHAFRAHPTRCC